MTRTREVDSEREMEKQLDDFVTRGYKIKDQGQYSAKVKDKDWGEVPTHGFIFLFTLIGSALLFSAADASASGAWIITILANIAYAGYSWFTAEEVVIKVKSGVTG